MFETDFLLSLLCFLDLDNFYNFAAALKELPRTKSDETMMKIL